MAEKRPWRPVASPLRVSHRVAPAIKKGLKVQKLPKVPKPLKGPKGPTVRSSKREKTRVVKRYTPRVGGGAARKALELYQIL